MNYLAHFYLSGTDEQIIIGNYIGDFIKGSDMDRYAAKIQEGVTLHRFIDHYTDNHPAVGKSKERIRSHFGKYAPVVVDVFYDFFLAQKWGQLHDTSLQGFADNIYKVLEKHYAILPGRSKRFYYYMVTNNILVQYRNLNGMQKVFYGLSRRAAFESNMEKAHLVLDELSGELQADFEQFIPDLATAVSKENQHFTGPKFN